MKSSMIPRGFGGNFRAPKTAWNYFWEREINFETAEIFFVGRKRFQTAEKYFVGRKIFRWPKNISLAEKDLRNNFVRRNIFRSRKKRFENFARRNYFAQHFRHRKKYLAMKFIFPTFHKVKLVCSHFIPVQIFTQCKVTAVLNRSS